MLNQTIFNKVQLTLAIICIACGAIQLYKFEATGFFIVILGTMIYNQERKRSQNYKNSLTFSKLILTNFILSNSLVQVIIVLAYSKFKFKLLKYRAKESLWINSVVCFILVNFLSRWYLQYLQHEKENELYDESLQPVSLTPSCIVRLNSQSSRLNKNYHTSDAQEIQI